MWVCFPTAQKLTVHIPFTDDIWFKRAFEYLKENPHNQPHPTPSSARGGGREKNVRLSQIEIDSGKQWLAQFSGP